MNTRQAAPTNVEPQQEPSRLVRALLFLVMMVLVIVLIVTITGALVYNSFRSPRREGKPVLNGVTVAPLVSIQTEKSFPYGLTTAADGSLYFTPFGTGGLQKVDPSSGTQSPIVPQAELPHGGAMAFSPDGTLYTIDYSVAGPEGLGALRQIGADGKVSSFGTMPGGKLIGLFAHITFDPDGNLFLSNPGSHEVWKINRDGKASIWWAMPSLGNTQASPTGLLYDAGQKQLIVGDATTNSIYRVSFKPEGTVGEVLLLYRQSGISVHGMAFDRAGRILFVAWDHENGLLQRIERDGKVTLLASGFRAPTSIAYRDGKVYVANSDIVFGTAKPILGLLPSPLQARAPFTVDVVTLPE